MTNPTNYFGQVPQAFYPSYPGYWPLAPQNAVNVPLTQQFPPFNNQMNYQCFLQPATYLPPYQSVVRNATISPGMVPVQNRISRPMNNSREAVSYPTF